MSRTSRLSAPTGARWCYAYLCTHVRVHKRLVLALGLAGAVIGLLASQATPEVYSARVAFRVNRDQSDGASCHIHVPWPVRFLQGIDGAAVRLRLPDPNLGGRLWPLLKEME
jgi:hypothetical protein